MKRLNFLFAMLIATTLWAQSSQTPPNTISSGPAQPAIQAGAANSSAAGAITNQNGAASVVQLDAQLQRLQQVLQETLPMLTSFNNQYGSSTASGAAQELGGALGRILSGNRNNPQPQSPSTTPNQSGSGTNLLGYLRNLFPTNGSNTAAADAGTLATLKTLQRDLEPVPGLLQSLNLGAGTGTSGYSYLSPTNQNGSSINALPTDTNSVAPLTPTGRAR